MTPAHPNDISIVILLGIGISTIKKKGGRFNVEKN